jgi:hypothetical protein
MPHVPHSTLLRATAARWERGNRRGREVADGGRRTAGVAA